MPRRIIALLVVPSLAIAEEKTSFDDHVFPIFQHSCLNCHNPDKTKGGLDLSSFTSALKGSSGGKIVEPGEIGSPLIASVQHTGEYKMPPEGDKLSAEQIAVLIRWIQGGLLENKSSAARKPTKPKFESTLRSDPAAKPDGPPPMPEHLLLEPTVVTSRPSSIHAIAASPWAPLLAVTGQRQVLLHHTESLELIGILPFPEGEPTALAFTPDSRYLIVGGGVAGKSGTTVTFDITTGARLLTAAKEFDSVLAADIRPSFDFVATGGPSRLLKIWNTETGDLVKSVKKHTDWITALDLSADGVLLASGDRNGGVWVWESHTANEFHTLRGHQAA
ncbi:MAG: c-type cytochrome domain-containing protein, partial [Luteolibacter sp.]